MNKNNLLKDNYPEIYTQISAEETKKIFPNVNIIELTSFSHTKVVWYCETCKQFYIQEVSSKTNMHRGCPFCTHQRILPGVTDLFTWCLENNRPDILEDWDYTKNNEYPTEVFPASSKKYYFMCQNGHKYEMTLSSKTVDKHLCPICANKQVLSGYNDLETYIHNNPQYQFILDTWDYSLNNFKPSEVTPKSHKKAYFKCPICGFSTLQTIEGKFTRSTDKCVVCTNRLIISGYNDLVTWVYNHPEYQFILDEWNYEKNNLFPSEVSKGTSDKYYFKCSNGHSFYQALHHRTGKNPRFCPICSHRKSAPELTLVNLLKKYFDSNTVSGSKIGKYDFDIYIPSLNLYGEYDGIFYHSSDDVKKLETIKNKLALKVGKIFRIKETSDIENINKFKEIKDGVIIYYVKASYNSEYFSELSKIFFDITKISISTEIIEQKLYEMKFLKHEYKEKYSKIRSTLNYPKNNP